MIKMNKLIGLAFTYVDDASSDNEFITAGRIGKKMIMKELDCEIWVASRILEVLGKKGIMASMCRKNAYIWCITN